MPEYAVYRILGNDLWPRHGYRSARRNLRFLIEHEPELPGAEKRFVVNRIFSRRAESEILRMLDTARFRYLHLPFRMGEYARAADDLRLPADYELSDELRSPRDLAQHNKTRYAVNVNGARNAAIDHAGEADWVLPLDGSCIFDRRGWDALAGKLIETTRPALPLPMYRLRRNPDYHGFDVSSHEGEEVEPQLALRSRSGISFHEGYRWGRLNKLELLNRLGLVEAGTQRAAEALRAGYVMRMQSGAPVLAGEESVDKLVSLRRHAERLLLLRLDRARHGSLGLIRQRLADRLKSEPQDP